MELPEDLMQFWVINCVPLLPRSHTLTHCCHTTATQNFLQRLHSSDRHDLKWFRRKDGCLSSLIPLSPDMDSVVCTPTLGTQQPTVFPQNCPLTAVLSTQTGTYIQETNYKCEQIMSDVWCDPSQSDVHWARFVSRWAHMFSICKLSVYNMVLFNDISSLLSHYCLIVTAHITYLYNVVYICVVSISTYKKGGI